jgi:hypothetical protein
MLSRPLRPGHCNFRTVSIMRRVCMHIDSPSRSIGNLLGEMNHKRAGVAANASIVLAVTFAALFR